MSISAAKLTVGLTLENALEAQQVGDFTVRIGQLDASKLALVEAEMPSRMLRPRDAQSSMGSLGSAKKHATCHAIRVAAEDVAEQRECSRESLALWAKEPSVERPVRCAGVAH